MKMKKSVLIIFLGNFYYDSRVTNLYKSFREIGYDVNVISFDWLTKELKTKKGEISVYKLKKHYFSFTYYLKFSFILIKRLLFSKADLIFAEDVYTLPFAAIFAQLKKSILFYDSREIYSHLAGLSNRKNVQAILKYIEKSFIKYAFKVITTGELDSEYIHKEYNINDSIVIRNLPYKFEIRNPFDFRKHFGLNDGIKIILYQGVILPGRGLKIIFDVLNKLSDCILVVLGDGEYTDYYKKLAKDKGIENIVYFFGKIEQRELLNYTAGADIGLALIENISLSYYYALPNKLFEYIYCGVPVIVSNLPQMKKIVENYKVGVCVDTENIDEIVSNLRNVLLDKDLRNELKQNCLNAASELNWNEEIKKLFNLIEKK